MVSGRVKTLYALADVVGQKEASPAQIALLLESCCPTYRADGKAAAKSGEEALPVDGLLPVCHFLVRSEGQAASVVLPVLIQEIEQLPQRRRARKGSISSTGGLLDLLGRFLRMLPEAGSQDRSLYYRLSGAMQLLLERALLADEEALAAGGGVLGEVRRAFLAGTSLPPLLPGDANRLAVRLCERLAGSHEGAQGATPTGTPGATPPGTPQRHLRFSSQDGGADGAEEFLDLEELRQRGSLLHACHRLVPLIADCSWGSSSLARMASVGIAQLEAMVAVITGGDPESGEMGSGYQPPVAVEVAEVATQVAADSALVLVAKGGSEEAQANVARLGEFVEVILDAMEGALLPMDWAGALFSAPGRDGSGAPRTPERGSSADSVGGGQGPVLSRPWVVQLEILCCCLMDRVGSLLVAEFAASADPHGGPALQPAATHTADDSALTRLRDVAYQMWRIADADERFDWATAGGAGAVAGGGGEGGGAGGGGAGEKEEDLDEEGLLSFGLGFGRPVEGAESEVKDTGSTPGATRPVSSVDGAVPTPPPGGADPPPGLRSPSQRLREVSVRSVSRAMGSAWRSGRQGAVEALMVATGSKLAAAAGGGVHDDGDDNELPGHGAAQSASAQLLAGVCKELHGDTEASRLVLPQLAEALAAAPGVLGRRARQHVAEALAIIAAAASGQGLDLSGAGSRAHSSRAHSSRAHSQGRHKRSTSHKRHWVYERVVGLLVQAYADPAAVFHHQRGPSGGERLARAAVTSALSSPATPSGAGGAGAGGSDHEDRCVLGVAMLRLAEGLQHSDMWVRRDLRYRCLKLFLDVGYLVHRELEDNVGPQQPAAQSGRRKRASGGTIESLMALSERQRPSATPRLEAAWRHLAELLPALAVAFEDVPPRDEGGGAGLGAAAKPAPGSASVAAGRKVAREAGAFQKLLRSFWFFATLYGLCPGPDGSPNRVVPVRGLPAVEPRWRAALETIAAWTPPLVMDATHRLLEVEVDLGGRLASLPPFVPAAMVAALAPAVAPSVSLAQLQQTSPGKLAYLLLVASMCTLRASSVLPWGGGPGAAESARRRNELRQSALLEYLGNTGDPSVDACLKAVAEHAFNTAVALLSRVAAPETARRPGRRIIIAGGGGGGGGADKRHYNRRHTVDTLLLSPLPAADAAAAAVAAAAGGGAQPLRHEWQDEVEGEAGALPRADVEAQMRTDVREMMAVFFIRSLSPTSGSLRTREFAGYLLRRLVAAFPHLLWSANCVGTMFDMLQQEESAPEGANWTAAAPGVLSTGHTSALSRLKSWLRDASNRSPSATQGLLHQFLIELPAESAAVHVHSGELLSMCSSSREVNPMERSAGGLAALNLKSRYQGRVEGISSMVVEGSVGRVLQQLVHRFKVAVQPHGGASDQRVAMGEACLQAGAWLSAPGSGSLASASQHSMLLSLLCWGPFTPGLLSRDLMCTATTSWAWVLSAARRLRMPLLTEVANAGLWTLDHRLGLFDTTSPGSDGLRPRLRPLPEDDGAWGGGDGPSSSSSSSARAAPEDCIAAHRVWLAFLDDFWEVARHGSEQWHRYVRELFGRLLQRALADPARLTTHPAAAGARFRLLLLALRYLRPAAPYAAAAASSSATAAGDSPAARRRGARGGSAELARRGSSSTGSSSSNTPGGRGGSAEGGSARGSGGGTVGLMVALLRERVYKAALLWFSEPPQWHMMDSRIAAAEEVHALEDFMEAVALDEESAPPGGGAVPEVPGRAHPVWGTLRSEPGGRDMPGGKDMCTRRRGLLRVLLKCEVERATAWAYPEDALAGDRSPPAHASITAEQLREHLHTAWAVDPRVALALPARFTSARPVLEAELQWLVARHRREPSLHALPGAVEHLVTPRAVADDSPCLVELSHWAPCSVTACLALIGLGSHAAPGRGGKDLASCGGFRRVMAYVMRVLGGVDPEEVAFFQPQLVQALRCDPGGLVEGYLLDAAMKAPLFAHRLIWTLQGEEAPPKDMSEHTKRSGWTPPPPNKIWGIVDRVRLRLLDLLRAREGGALDFFHREFALFDAVTSISGVLFPLDADARRQRIGEELRKIKLNGRDLYLPTNPHARVLGIQVDSGTPMQSAAKVPILVAFDVEIEHEKEHMPPVQTGQACIFKVGDDCRQDVLALQIIAMLKDGFQAAGLPLYLFPYGVLPTGYERGIIEVVPRSQSRASLGETADGGLYEIFAATFGAPGSPAFERARYNFIASSAGYAVASFILQSKDRHNGNILVDDEGHLVHIDFGFIFDISPGGNLGFESAAFKLSHEMTQLIDPGGTKTSPHYQLFESLVVRGYLTARGNMGGILAAVELMKDSALPCFGYGAPLENLRKRFQPELSDRQAASFIVKRVRDAYGKWTTGLYDVVQYLQQNIPK